MASRINPDFYGAENTFVTLTPNTKYSPYTLQDLVTRGVYDGGSLDTTASPWGVGQSSISSQFAFFPTKGASWTLFDTHNDKKNTPLFFFRSSEPKRGFSGPWDLVGADATDANFTKAIYKSRTYPNTVINNNQVKSNLPLDSGARVDLDYTTYISYLTYMNYQKIRIYPRLVYYIPPDSNTVQSTSLDDIINHNVSVDYIVGIIVTTIDRDGGVVNLNYSVGSYELPIPNEFKPCYYTSDDKWVRPWRSCYFIGHWDYSSEFGVQFRAFNTDDVYYTSQFETPNSGNPIRGYQVVTGYGSMSRHNQVFDDVSYHWEYGITPYGTTIHTVEPIETGDLYQSGLYWCYSRMVLDGDYVDKNLAFVNAIMHELSFIGFPCARTASEAQNDIGSNYIYLPVFDEHMITTGEYLSGTSSLNLDNSTWTDIFGNEMPDYDPEYDPEPPEPGENDQGDLSNEYPNRYSNAGGLAQWVVNQSVLIQLAAFLNGSYLPTSADLDADFKGTNPMDYIVSVQKYPFTLPNVGTSSDIYIGKNNTSLQGKKLFPDFGGVSPIAINSASTFDFGSISIPYYFNDFRDYQSKIFLFMPFIGTDELDPRLYIGHTLSLVYRVDYNTGTVIAEIKRDGLTMETKNGTISITVPFLAANMGAYQNQLAQLSYSKDMTKIKGIGTALSAGFTMAAGASGTLSSGQFPLAAASNLTQAGVQLAANATQLSQLDYQIEHTAPQLGTISTAGAATAFFMDDRARIIIARPKMLDGYNSTQYSHTIGNACCKTGTLSAFSGYTQAATAILDDVHTKQSHRQATEQERQLLRRALQNGIYL